MHREYNPEIVKDYIADCLERVRSNIETLDYETFAYGWELEAARDSYGYSSHVREMSHQGRYV